MRYYLDDLTNAIEKEKEILAKQNKMIKAKNLIQEILSDSFNDLQEARDKKQEIQENIFTDEVIEKLEQISNCDINFSGKDLYFEYQCMGDEFITYCTLGAKDKMIQQIQDDFEEYLYRVESGELDECDKEFYTGMYQGVIEALTKINF